MLPELEKILPDMTVAEMVNRNQASLDTLRHLLKQNPSIRVSDILTPSPDSHEAEVRGVMFDIFHRVGKVMGRNSEGAVQEDFTKLLEKYIFSSLHFSGNIVEKVQQEVGLRVDPDMKDKAIWSAQSYRQALGIKLYNRISSYMKRHSTPFFTNPQRGGNLVRKAQKR